jgi:squalene synthase HpnC
MISPSEARSGKSHRDENFPVASRLIHPHHRGAILAFYDFVRTADDIADHPTLPPDEKLALLDRLEAALLGRDSDPAADPLRVVLAERGLTPRHALDLLAAFRLDVTKRRYADWGELFGYCSLSAMPVGRYVLDVHGEDQSLWPANDALCAALQIVNHVQDCGKDFRALDRVYLPEDILTAHGAAVADLAAPAAPPGLAAALHEIATRTEALLTESALFARHIMDWRLGLEVAAIQRLAEVLNRGLMRRDPLSQPVHLGKRGFAAVALGGIVRGVAVRTFAGRGPAARAKVAG